MSLVAVFGGRCWADKALAQPTRYDPVSGGGRYGVRAWGREVRDWGGDGGVWVSL
jgi:hypothetical protein